MAKYTITIKSLIDNNFDFKMTNYPIFDKNYRETLNNNILYHYYESEIGFETAPLFRLYLNQKLQEIMPKYNVLYTTQLNLINNNLLLNNVNLSESLEGSNSTETSSSSSSSNNGKNLFQDTPQGNISQQDIDAENVYATNLTLNNNSIEDESSASGSGTNSYLKTIIGNNGGKFNIELLNDINNNLMNIDLMIINELSDLFMGLL